MTNNAILHTTVGIACIIVSGAIAISESISYYELKYGRDLVFEGSSKFLLAGAACTAGIGFLLIARERYQKHQTFEAGNSKVVAFCIAFLLLIAAYAKEHGIF